MPSKRRKRPRDPNQLGKLIVDMATGERPKNTSSPVDSGKDPAASAMGRKGGAARAASLSEDKRKEIARKAAAARWKK